MKARRRHELQQNVLSAELGKLAEFFRKHGTYVVWGAAIAAFVLLVATYTISKSRERRRSIHARYNRAMTDQTIKLEDRLKDLEALSEQDTDTDIAALACVAVGDHSAARLATANALTTDADRKRLLDQAEAYYRKAIARFADRPVIVGRAHMGLAFMAENRRDFDAAEAEYRAVLAMPDLQGGSLADAAARGLETLDDLRTPVVMATTAPAPRKKEEP